MAGFISERVAGFILECLAGFVGIRIVEHDFALMKQLSQFRFYAIRLFVHVSNDNPGLRREIEGFFQTELPDFPFSP
jgi:hypothetical protein